ncbi:MAG: hypothetical protein QM536_07750 [Chitinophagaceae bacterium]|nr:hypothetical protein [Chitinophagaceae bacterium]
MKLVFFLNIVFFFSLNVYIYGQSTKQEDILSRFDEFVGLWDDEAKKLSQYAGLSDYCMIPSYKEDIIEILNGIHHYDSIIYRNLKQKEKNESSHELRVSIKQIEDFEGNYKPKMFLKKLNSECAMRRTLESEYKKGIDNDLGEQSYDEMVVIVESDLRKYIRHITKLVDHIKKHSHHLLPE